MSKDNGLTELRKHWHESMKKELKQRQSWAHPSMISIKLLTKELEKDGWKLISSITAPSKRIYLGWTPDNDLPFRFSVGGQWPKLSFTSYVDGDAWPCRYPVMYKELNDQ